jgi:hypothetical protein
MRRRRFRKWAKWACTLVVVLAAGLAVFSRFYKFQVFGFCRNDTALWSVSVTRGLLHTGVVAGVTPADVGPQQRWRLERYPGWDWGTNGEARYTSAATWTGGVLWGSDTSGWGAGVSVLYPVIAATVSSSLLWFADRRRSRTGLCSKCGYDRRGLAADAPCPECGQEPTSPTSAH